MRPARLVRNSGVALALGAVALGTLGWSGLLGPGSDRIRSDFGTLAEPDLATEHTPSSAPPGASPTDSPEASPGAPSDLDADAGAYERPDPGATATDGPAPPAASPFTTTAPRGAIDTNLWPVRVEVPALGVSAPVEAVGVGAERELIIPASPMDVGWFQGGSVPGEPGVALLTSHVDTRTEGRGVFAGLNELGPGDTVMVTAADGSVQHWSIVARTQHRKDSLPPELFSRSGTARLALVTCGGPFDRDARSYRDNVIVWAEPRA
jgi:sortase (surface protein transpeptidase)